MFTFAGIAFIYNPMKMGLVGLYLPKFDADALARHRGATSDRTMAFLVPAMAELLVAHPRLRRARPHAACASVSIGSAPLAPQTLLTLQERLPDATVSNSYGMTEAGPAYIVMPKDEVTKRIGSVGKPVGPMQLKIVRDDDTECDATRGRRAAHPHGGRAARVLQGRGRDRDAPGPPTAGCAAATSRTSTRTASSTSPAARRT